MTEVRDNPVQRCLNCGFPASVIWVHGHGQCSHCGVNIAPCCDGAQECPVDPVMGLGEPKGPNKRAD